ncbi:MAG: S8 family serine peptidase [Candidatus Nitrosocosmicus sp.]
MNADYPTIDRYNIKTLDPINQTNLRFLMDLTEGDPDIIIGLIDGPVDLLHPAFDESKITAVKKSYLSMCRDSDNVSCIHGTFISGILCAKRELGAPAIAPKCTLLLRPIFFDQISNVNSKGESFNNMNNAPSVIPSSNSEELSTAIIETVDAGANIINLSLGLSTTSLIRYNELYDAYEYARKNNVIIVSAAGNQGVIGNVSLLADEWILPVSASDEYGVLAPGSNFGPLIGRRGIMAPGVNIRSTLSGGGFLNLSGTSCAAPFVSGSIALLWSLFREASSAQLVNSIRNSTFNFRNRSVIPPLLNAKVAYENIKKLIRNK